MRKYFFIVLLITCNLSSPSQKTNRDSLRIDSLKKVLPTLTGTARIDCLNSFCESFLYGSNRKRPEIRYDSIAYGEALEIGYKKGIAISLLIIAAVEGNDIRVIRLRTGEIPNEKVASYESKIEQAKSLGEEIKDYRILSLAYGLSAESVFEQKENNTRIDYYKKAIDYAQKSGDITQERSITAWLGDDYFYSNNFDEGFEYYKKCVLLARKTASNNDYGDWLSIYAFYNMGHLFNSIGDYSTALSYYREGASYAKTHNSDWVMENEIGSLYFKINQFDSSLYYMQKFVNKGSGINSKETQVAIYIMTKEYDKAIELSKTLIDTLTAKRRWGGLYYAQMMAGRASFEKKDYKAALKFTGDALTKSYMKIEGPLKMEASRMLSKIFHQLGKNDSAYYYLSEYTSIRDSLLKNQFLWKLSDFKSQIEFDKKEDQLALLNKDNKIKEQQLKQEATFKYFLIAAFIALVFAGLYVFRNLSLNRKNEKLKQETAQKEWAFQKLESEKKQADLQRQTVELEMQALRAQMNPHFIFNCLSSINRIIMKNDSQSASDYLTRFSRLMRMVLINSQRSMIPLEDELQMLRLYLDMERLRFKDSFNYSIIFTNTIDEGAVFVPPLLLQPFCENAIWHGLIQKDGQGLLTVELSVQDNILNCIITDNGIGREKAQERKSKTAEKEKSMGLKITTERLALLNRERGLHTFYEIEDLKDEYGRAAGTKVVLKISIKETVEETA
jgi:sensor histidine kinase YesM